MSAGKAAGLELKKPVRSSYKFGPRLARFLMPPVRTLRSPPITEGLIDLRVDESKFTREKLETVATALAADYPLRQDRRRISAEFAAGPGEPLHAGAKDLGVFGATFSSKDNLQVAQFRSDGFTLNRLAPYEGWEKVFPEAMRLWRVYSEVIEPGMVRRVAVRYINRIPFADRGVDLADYLRSPVPFPPGIANFVVSSLLTSILVSEPASPQTVKITQSLESNPPQGPHALLLDIDAFQQGEWRPDDNRIPVLFDQLRALKNRVFFESLTEQAIKRFE